MAFPWMLVLLFALAAGAADLQLDARVLLLSTEASKEWAAPFLTQIMSGEPQNSRTRNGIAAACASRPPASRMTRSSPHAPGEVAALRRAAPRRSQPLP
jgi:hypothetical protein